MYVSTCCNLSSAICWFTVLLLYPRIKWLNENINLHPALSSQRHKVQPQDLPLSVATGRGCVCFGLFVFVFVCCETGSHYEVTKSRLTWNLLETWLTLNPPRSSCLCLLGATLD